MLFFAGDSMGILLGSLFNDPRMAMGVFPVVYTPYIITGGFLSTSSNSYKLSLFNFSIVNPAIKWIQYVSPIRYAFEGLLTNEFEDLKFPFPL
jgi:hypothetical protein